MELGFGHSTPSPSPLPNSSWGAPPEEHRSSGFDKGEILSFGRPILLRCVRDNELLLDSLVFAKGLELDRAIFTTIVGAEYLDRKIMLPDDEVTIFFEEGEYFGLLLQEVDGLISTKAINES